MFYEKISYFHKQPVLLVREKDQNVNGIHDCYIAFWCKTNSSY